MHISITNLQKSVRIPSAKIKAIASKAARSLKLDIKELSLVFVGEAQMRTINRTYLKHDYVTDVITFTHGEIVICPQVAKRQAVEHGSSTAQELVLYVIHGLLHLAGYDDHTPAQIKRMRDKEQALMRL